MEIKVLPTHIANMIAAGEVVQRPSSVVKELVENAIDSGADNISVIIKDSGRTLIQVIDNGKGMNSDEAVLCFERHATSKIEKPEDLHNLLSFGFRGEALASIVSVSELTMKTRKEGEDIGTEVFFSASELVDKKEVSCPVGTNISVRNLFYNIPARRKFLKSDNVELKHIIEEFVRLALTREKVNFSLKHNDKDLYVLRSAMSLKFRILDVFGAGVIGNIVDIKAETSIVQIGGFIARPDTAKRTLGSQYLFVNGRYFRSPYIHKAIMKGYEEVLPEGFTPTYFIYLNVNPSEIDVNIHPTKTEIKFENDSIIFQTIYAAVKETLAKNSFVTAIDFDENNSIELPVIGRHFEEYKEAKISSNIDFNYDPFSTSTIKNLDFDSYNKNFNNQDYSNYVDKRENYGKLFESDNLPQTKILVIKNKFVLKPSKSGLLIVNIKRAWERILYDEFLNALSQEIKASATILFPVSLQIGVQEVLVIKDNIGLLEKLGFDIQIFGEDSISINAIPDGFSADKENIEQLFGEIVKLLTESKDLIEVVFNSRMAESLSKYGNNSIVSSQVEAEALLERLYSCNNPEFTVSGKKIISVIYLEELEKRF